MFKKINTIICISLSLLISADAAAEISEYYFTASERCPLYNNLQACDNIGDVQSMLGEQYQVIKNEEGDFINIKASNEYPESRWVRKSCAQIENKHEIFTNLSSNQNASVDVAPSNFAPFFTENKNDVTELQPLLPELNVFDKEALEICGEWGQRVTRGSLSPLFSGKFLKKIYKALNGTVYPSSEQESLSSFADNMIHIWTAYDAFEHVICGQPQEDKLGGLNYAGRYVEMQRKKWGGLSDNCSKIDVQYPVYTIGVDFITPQKKIITKCPTSYNYKMHVEDILIAATKAFKQVYKQQGDKGSTSCIFANKYGNYVLNKKDDAIYTFYPHISPDEKLEFCDDLAKISEE